MMYLMENTIQMFRPTRSMHELKNLNKSHMRFLSALHETLCLRNFSRRTSMYLNRATNVYLLYTFISGDYKR